MYESSFYLTRVIVVFVIEHITKSTTLLGDVWKARLE